MVKKAKKSKEKPALVDSKEVKKMVEKLEKMKINLAKDRDEMRGLLMDLEAIVDRADSAYQSLEAAVDYLSEYL